MTCVNDGCPVEYYCRQPSYCDLDEGGDCTGSVDDCWEKERAAVMK